MNKQSLNHKRIAKFFFLLFLFAIFFPIRYVFPTTSSFATGLYSDFTSISLYLNDIFLFIAFFFILCFNIKNLFKILPFPFILAIIWLIFNFISHLNEISGLNIWYFIKFFELLVVLYGTIVLIFKNQTLKIKILFFLVFLCLGTLQSVIGLLQFIDQSPVGLNAVGEQIIYPNLWGVAKIVSSGTSYIRAYGTFPHPNLLSAFLIATILINIYLLTFVIWKRYTNIWLNFALFINILGLTATFSRGAYLALGVGLLCYFSLLYGFRKHVIMSSLQNLNPESGSGTALSKGLFSELIFKILLALFIAFLTFHPFLFSRATISDKAVLERGIYNQTALNIIKDKPFFGLGVGENVFHMKHYSPIELEAWQIQPIHNFFLLSAAELGIIGALLLIWIFFSHLFSIWKLIRNRKSKIGIGNYQTSLYQLTLFIILICFLILMFFDHYFYTLQQTQMLLWIILGLIAAELQPQDLRVGPGSRHFPKDLKQGIVGWKQ